MKVVVEEFFHLFKTPWEFYQPGKRYSAILYDSGEAPPPSDADVIAIYATCLTSAPNDHVTIDETVVPIYCGMEVPPAVRQTKSDSLGLLARTERTVTMRFSYNLFREVEFLLREGQPVAHAGIPTLEMHIEALRSLLVSHLALFVEIPPLPATASGIACLTHDVDHPSILNHKLDQTLAGFIYRATMGSMIDVFSRRKTLRQFWRNLGAVCSLPLVFAGRRADLWDCFRRYRNLEGEFRSTFFFIPVKGEAGRSPRGKRREERSSPYGAVELSEKIEELEKWGAEIGVHGINAWASAEDGRKEREAIGALTGSEDAGIRMHWLYFDQNAPRRLEEAGYAYDSTVGYNETVGFKSGTAQVYQQLSTADLLELPMIAMDTALFYPSYLRLRPDEALKLAARLLKTIQRFGGVFTLNWHDRSLAPERLWDEVYEKILLLLKENNMWVAPAMEVVQWFRARRETVFSSEHSEGGRASVSVRLPELPKVKPSFRLRVYRGSNAAYTDQEIYSSGRYEFEEAA